MIVIEPIGPKDYVDSEELQRAAAFIAEPGKVQEIEKERVLALCHQVGDLLRPFTLVSTTKNRWRDKVLEVAEKVHDAAVALHIDDQALGTLSEGIGGLEHYRSMAKTLEACGQMSRERMMDASETMDVMAQAIERCATSANAHPLDEWQLNKDANAVNDFGSALIFKLMRHPHEDDECTRADQLLSRVAEVISVAAAREGLSTDAKEHFTHLAENARGRREDIAEARARAREDDRQKRLSPDPFWR